MSWWRSAGWWKARYAWMNHNKKNNTSSGHSRLLHLWEEEQTETHTEERGTSSCLSGCILMPFVWRNNIQNSSHTALFLFPLYTQFHSKKRDDVPFSFQFSRFDCNYVEAQSVTWSVFNHFSLADITYLVFFSSPTFSVVYQFTDRCTCSTHVPVSHPAFIWQGKAAAAHLRWTWCMWEVGSSLLFKKDAKEISLHSVKGTYCKKEFKAWKTPSVTAAIPPLKPLNLTPFLFKLF